VFTVAVLKGIFTPSSPPAAARPVVLAPAAPQTVAVEVPAPTAAQQPSVAVVQRCPLKSGVESGKRDQT
jgi:hypothetical protein